MSNGHHVSDSKVGTIRVTKIENTRPCPLRTMMVERNKVNIIQSEEKKTLHRCVRAKWDESRVHTFDLGLRGDSVLAVNHGWEF